MAWRNCLFILSSLVFMMSFDSENLVEAALCEHCIGQCDTAGLCGGTCDTLYYGEQCDKPCPCTGGCDKMTGRCGSCDYYKYGDFCNNTCSDGCTFRGCDRDTGVCASCRYTVYGDFCDQNCSEHCDGCERKDGNCTDCQSGYWGNKCQKECPANCKYSNCDKDTGKCKFCKPSYRGEYCEIKCPYENCKSCFWSYNDNMEKCKCFDGFYGDRCDMNCSDTCLNDNCIQYNGRCYDCKAGYFGDFCAGKCYEHCAKCTDNQSCEKCMDGYFGSKCDQKCPDGCGECSRDGRLCLSCADINHDEEDAECLCNKYECTPDMSYCSGCRNSSWFSTNTFCCPCNIRHCANEDVDVDNCEGQVKRYCNDGCKPGYFGTLCSKQCSPHCGGVNHICDRTVGTCIQPCEEGWAGSKCDIHCTYLPHCTKCTTDKSSFSASAMCLECETNYFLSRARDSCMPCLNCDVTCNITTGKCPVCSKGYHHDAYGYCSMSCGNCMDQNCHSNGSCVTGQCQPGFYGDHCDWTCSPNCQNKSCEIKTGKCTFGCVNGYYGDQCVDKCKNCLNDVCNVTTGKCLECKPTFYGSGCSIPCAGCIDGVCDRSHGCYKGCKPGRYSFLCDKPCRYGCPVCEQVTGTCRLCITSKPACLRDFRIKWELTNSLQSNASSCIAGMYGPNCDVPCPKGCLFMEDNYVICDRYTGACPLSGCKPHLYGLHCDFDCQFCGSGPPSCHRTEGYCEVCEDGHYGKHCVLKCGQECAGGACHQVTAECTNGCNDGWMGTQCSLKMEAPPSDSPMNGTTLAVIIVLAVLAVIALIIFGIIVILRNSSRRQGRYNGTSTTES